MSDVECMIVEEQSVEQDQEQASANVRPPPGLDFATEFTEATDEKSPVMITIDKTDTVSCGSRESDPDAQPMKVKFADADASVEASSELPQPVDDAKAALEVENETLAIANAQLAWENAMLRQQGDISLGSDELQAQGWWPQQQWPMSPPWPTVTQPGDLVYFHSLKNVPELNDEYGNVERWDDDSQRWVVKLISSGEQKYAKPENLMVLREQQQCYPQYWGGMYGQEKGSRKSKKSGVKKNTSATWSFASDTTTASGGDSGDGKDESTGRTTVMMRNIPNDYTVAMVLELLDEQGFEARYNLMYLPMDYHRKAGFGYAFIDFTTPEEADRFHKHFEGFQEWKVASVKICSVGWSTLQGLQAHIERYRNSPVMHEFVPAEFKPMLFENGKPVSFPAPTKTVRAPRMKKSGGNGPQNVQKELTVQKEEPVEA